MNLKVESSSTVSDVAIEPDHEEILKTTILRSKDCDDGCSIHRWSVILAGGEGGGPLPRAGVRVGEKCPKQFFALAGKRSMFEETVERARQISTFDRILTVIGCSHLKFLPRRSSYNCGQIIEQPANRETAAAILVCAAWAMAADPHATLLVLPSDQVFGPASSVTPQLVTAVRLAEEFEDKIVLLGAETDSAEISHGRILASRATELSEAGVPFNTVVGLEGGPKSGKVKRFFRKGYLWNTMMFAVKATTLWNLSRQFLPELTRRFEILKRVREVARFREGRPDLTVQALKHIYGNIPAVNFSQELLSNAKRHLVVLPMREVVWS